MLINIIASKLISQSGELAGQVLGMGLRGSSGGGAGPWIFTGVENSILLVPLKVNKPCGFD